MESKLKHLELIQGVVNRLATDSFRVKGWAVVLVTALFVLLAIEDRLHAAYIALAPVLVFWGLDGYYLWQERLFRALYDRVRVVDESEVDFSMATAAFRTGWKRSWLGSTLSITLVPFYGALIIAIALVVFYLPGEQAINNGS